LGLRRGFRSIPVFFEAVEVMFIQWCNGAQKGSKNGLIDLRKLLENMDLRKTLIF